MKTGIQRSGARIAETPAITEKRAPKVQPKRLPRDIVWTRERTMARDPDRSAAESGKHAFTHFVMRSDTGAILGRLFLDQMIGEDWEGTVRLIPTDRDKNSEPTPR